jgi:hypothetical protein
MHFRDKAKFYIENLTDIHRVPPMLTHSAEPSGEIFPSGRDADAAHRLNAASLQIFRDVGFIIDFPENLAKKGIRLIGESFTTLVDMPMGDKRFTRGMQLENETKLEGPPSEADIHNKSLAFLLFPCKKDLPIAILAICGSPTGRIYEVNIARLHKSRDISHELEVSVPFCSGMVNIC